MNILLITLAILLLLVWTPQLVTKYSQSSSIEQSIYDMRALFASIIIIEIGLLNIIGITAHTLSLCGSVLLLYSYIYEWYTGSLIKREALEQLWLPKNWLNKELWKALLL